MPWPALQREVDAAIDRGVQALLVRQTPDGRWLDFDLAAGTSEAWTTAWVGWSLAGHGATAEQARARAAHALAGLSTSTGWGYNRATEADGDSTAWAIRFLATMGDLERGSGEALILRYVDAAGRGRTFPDRPSSWGAAHADVTAMVGLALVAVGATPESIRRVRRAVLDGRERGGAWHAFWWASDDYATAWSVALLAASGGIPGDVADEVRDWLARTAASGSHDTSFDAAFRLLCAVWLGDAGGPMATEFVDELVERADRGWPPSPVLFVPDTDADGVDPASCGVPYADVHGSITTAICCAALRRWSACVA